jgi:hypothetical protein
MMTTILRLSGHPVKRRLGGSATQTPLNTLNPPSIGTTAPVTNEAASLHSH